MKNPFLFLLCAGVGIWLAHQLVFAFTEPTAPPPQNNVPGPLTIGSGRQEKKGDITLQNLKATSITLGDETRFTWLDAAGACTWDGWKCDCRNDTSSASNVAITMGIECRSGQLNNMRIVKLEVSSKEKKCATAAPAPCKASLYTYYNEGAPNNEWYDPFGWF